MLITKASMLTGVTHTRDVPVDHARLAAWEAAGRPGLIQKVFSDLSADDREFLLSGVTPDEWDMYMKDLEES